MSAAQCEAVPCAEAAAACVTLMPVTDSQGASQIAATVECSLRLLDSSSWARGCRPWQCLLQQACWEAWPGLAHVICTGSLAMVKGMEASA